MTIAVQANPETLARSEADKVINAWMEQIQRTSGDTKSIAAPAADLAEIVNTKHHEIPQVNPPGFGVNDAGDARSDGARTIGIGEGSDPIVNRDFSELCTDIRDNKEVHAASRALCSSLLNATRGRRIVPKGIEGLGELFASQGLEIDSFNFIDPSAKGLDELNSTAQHDILKTYSQLTSERVQRILDKVKTAIKSTSEAAYCELVVPEILTLVSELTVSDDDLKEWGAERSTAAVMGDLWANITTAGINPAFQTDNRNEKLDYALTRPITMELKKDIAKLMKTATSAKSNPIRPAFTHLAGDLAGKYVFVGIKANCTGTETQARMQIGVGAQALFKHLETLQKSDLEDGLVLALLVRRGTCTECYMAKQSKGPFDDPAGVTTGLYFVGVLGDVRTVEGIFANLTALVHICRWEKQYFRQVYATRMRAAITKRSEGIQAFDQINPR